MKIYRSIGAFQSASIKKPVITFGSFDGVHNGHTFIFDKMKEHAEAIGGETVVTTFHPHPRRVIYAEDKAMKLLTPIDEKIHHLEKQDIDHLVIIPFSIEFSQMSPKEYIETFILRHYKPHTIMIGYDHHFGLNRSGDINTLRLYQGKGDFEVQELPQKKIDSMKISSTIIRRSINDRDIRHANTLLGYHYALYGHVVHGEKIGTKIGYKTANISLTDPNKLVPGSGIYAVLVHYGPNIYQGMLYIGTRPTVLADGPTTIEVHLFEFDQNLYEEEIVVEIIDFIRKDATFGSLEEMTENIRSDKEATLKILDGEKVEIQT